MPGKPTKKPTAQDLKDQRKRQLVADAATNPNGFFTFEETGIICGFGGNAMTALAGAGAPQAFRKMNPTLLREWIAENQERIGKLTDAKGEN